MFDDIGNSIPETARGLGVATGSPTDGELRRSLRVDVSFRTVILASSVGDADVQIVNMSRFGLLANTGAEFRVGDITSVQLPLIGERPVRIVWGHGGRVGCEFLPPIEDRAYAELLVHIRPH